MPHGLCLAGKCTVAGVALLKLGAALGRQSMLCATGSPRTQCPARRQDSPTGRPFLHPLLSCFSCVTGSLNKPDYCSPLLKNLQCVSVACKMKGRWLVWLTEPPAASLSTCPAAGISVSALGHLPVHCVFHEARSQTFLGSSAVPAAPCWER